MKEPCGSKLERIYIISGCSIGGGGVVEVVSKNATEVSTVFDSLNPTC